MRTIIPRASRMPVRFARQLGTRWENSMFGIFGYAVYPGLRGVWCGTGMELRLPYRRIESS